MDTTTDERLTRVETLLQNLLERQRLTRFDTVMFLAYPLVIAGMTLLPNAYLQYQALQNVSIMGVALGSILVVLTLFFVLGLVVGFTRFVFAYLVDNLRGRILAARFLITFAGLLAIQLLLMFLGPQVLELARKDSSLVPWGIPIPSILFTATLGFAIFELWEGMTDRFTKRILRWFETNAPLTLEASTIELVATRQNLAKDAESSIRLASVSMCVACGFYGAMVILATRASGVLELAAYHAVFLAVLLVATLMVVVRKKIKTFASEQVKVRLQRVQKLEQKPESS
jgi:hypothetical protein